MNVFHHVALQSLKRSPARTLVTIVGIALAAALMTVVAAFGTSLLHFLVISAENKYGDWHVSFDAVDTAFVQAQAQDPQVAHTAVLENLGYATLEGVQSPEKPYLFLAGLPAASWDTLRSACSPAGCRRTTERCWYPPIWPSKGVSPFPWGIP